MLSRLVRSVRAAATTPKAGAPMFEKLEDRQLLATSGVIAGTKVKGTNLSSGGVSTNQTLITVPFTGNITIADLSKIQLRGYAINPLTGGQKKMVIGVVSAQVLSSNHRYLQITSDRLMRKGGQIILQSGALKDDNGDTLAQQTVKTLKGQNKERFTLACRAFKATDFNKFSNDLFSASPTPTTASSAIAEGTVTSQLTAFLQKKVDQGVLSDANRDKALTKYNSSTTKSIIPDANMRAAVVSLYGTGFESAIAVFLDGANPSGKAYTIIDFQTPNDPATVVAETHISGTGRLSTVLKPEFKGEPFQVISAFLAHEALHQDATVSLEEEEVATMCETFCYAQQAIVDSSFLSSGTKLVALENSRLMALLQSGRAIFPYVGLLNGPIRNAAAGIFPGAKTATDGHGVFTSYDNFIKRHYQERGATSATTTGNALLKTYYNKITGKTAPSTLNFSAALITDVDSFQQIVGIKQAIKLAGSLKLSL